MNTFSTLNTLLRNTINATLLSTSLLSACVFAGQTEIDSIETASMQMNSQQLQVIAKQEQGYLQALANYRLAIVQNISANKDQATKSLSDAIAALESLVLSEPNNDEAWALLSQSYGLMISFKPSQAKVFGEKASAAIEQAYLLAPENPRIMLFKGIMYFTTPKAYGGDKNKAIELLDQAITLYSNDRDSGNYWGEAEAYVWRGMSYQALNQPTQAKSDFEHALTLAPNFGWAKMLLKSNS